MAGLAPSAHRLAMADKRSLDDRAQIPVWVIVAIGVIALIAVMGLWAAAAEATSACRPGIDCPSGNPAASAAPREP
jgi:hypothetical protein